MTTQAKNRLLAAIVLAMLFIIAVAVNTQPARVAYIPSSIPMVVAIEDVKPAYDMAEFECMRANVYFEAGNQRKRDKEAIALVALTRVKVKSYPSTVCGVVKQWRYNKRGVKVCQFSWYCDGKSDRPNLTNPLERKAWEDSTAVADAAMRGRIKDFLGGATNYHADYVTPDFSKPQHRKRYHRIAVHGVHIFYRDIALKLKA